MMPDGSRSIDSLLKFHKYAGMEGWINPGVARARRNAIEQLAGELQESECQDVRTIDVKVLASRFHKLDEASIRSEALELYAERLRMALVDFLAWCDNPAGFRSIGGEARRAIERGQLSAEQQVAERITLEATENPTNIVPVPLRRGETVYIANLPIDLSAAEAERVVAVIRAFAHDHDHGPDEQPK